MVSLLYPITFLSVRAFPVINITSMTAESIHNYALTSMLPAMVYSLKDAAKHAKFQFMATYVWYF